MDIDSLNNSLETLKNKRQCFESLTHYLGLIVVILGLIAAMLGAALLYYNWKKENVNKEIIKIDKQISNLKEEENNSQLSEITRRLILLEYGKTSTKSDVVNPNPQFESKLLKEFNLTKAKLNLILENQIKQNENLLDKAIALNMKGKVTDALGIFKEIIKTSNNNYHLAISNSFVGSIYLHREIVSGVDPGSYLLQAEKLFNELLTNDFVAVSIREGENYNLLGIYFKRLGKFEVSIGYYEKSLSIFQKLNEDYPDKYNLDIGIQYHNLYILLNNYEKPNAIDFLLKAYEYKKSALNDEQYVKALFLNTINSLLNHYSKNHTVNNSVIDNYFDEGDNIIQEVFGNEKELNGYFVEISANISASYGFHLAENFKNTSKYKRGIFLMEQSHYYFTNLKQKNYPLSLLVYSNLLHNLGREYKNFEFEFSNSILTEAISIREQLVSSIQGKQYEVSLADSYLIISELYNIHNEPSYKDYALKAKTLYSKYMDDDESLKTYFNQANKLLN